MRYSFHRPNIPNFGRSDRSDRGRTAWGNIEINLLVLGCLVNCVAYDGFAPIAVVTVFLAVGMSLLLFTVSGNYFERKIFLRTFAIGWAVAGVSAVYANMLGDFDQLNSDAGSFYTLASKKSHGMTLDEIRQISEGAGAVVLWRTIYDAFAAVGFQRAPYIGILVNVFSVAFTGVIAIKMARSIYGEDQLRFKRLMLLFGGCGIFWLFSGIHIRDGLVLLALTGLTYSWVVFLARPLGALRLAIFALVNFAAMAILGYLRAEFAFAPIAMAFSGIAALMFGRKKQSNNSAASFIFFFAFIALVSLLAVFNMQLVELMERGGAGYTKHSAGSHGEESLGMAVVVNQPIPIRMIVGSVYLFIFPIPFWVGLQFESAYALFKSLNVIFFYFFTPLLALAIWKLWRVKETRTYRLLFLLFYSLGFTLAVAVTSLESRHLGAFLAPMFVLALLPDLQKRREWASFRHWCVLYAGFIFVLHVLWGVLKLT